MRRRKLLPKPPDPPEGYTWGMKGFVSIPIVESAASHRLHRASEPTWQKDPAYNWRITKGKPQSEEK